MVSIDQHTTQAHRDTHALKSVHQSIDSPQQPAADKPRPKPKPTTLLPSADELFDSIDAPAFFGGAAAAKRQAAEITASRPTPQAPQQQPPRKKQATVGGPKAVEVCTICFMSMKKLKVDQVT